MKRYRQWEYLYRNKDFFIFSKSTCQTWFIISNQIKCQYQPALLKYKRMFLLYKTTLNASYWIIHSMLYIFLSRKNSKYSYKKMNTMYEVVDFDNWDEEVKLDCPEIDSKKLIGYKPRRIHLLWFYINTYFVC